MVSPLTAVVEFVGLATMAPAPGGWLATDHEYVNGSSSASLAVTESVAVLVGAITYPGLDFQTIIVGGWLGPAYGYSVVTVELPGRLVRVRVPSAPTVRTPSSTNAVAPEGDCEAP